MFVTRKILPCLLLALLLTAATPQLSLTREQVQVDDSFQPVVVTGTRIGAFVGAPVNELLIYAYLDGAWMPIPYQIDEKTTNEEGERVYAAEGDGRLDADEELVVMLKDMGEQAPVSAWIDGAEEDYRIGLTTEAADGTQRWVYVFRGSELDKSTEDYVNFSGEAQQVFSENYRVGFLEGGFALDELQLNNSGMDILDRTKLRLRTGFFRYTEDNLPIEIEPIVPIKDGAVRLVWGPRGGFAYGSLFQVPQVDVDLTEFDVSIEEFRFSLDFNAQVVSTSDPTTYVDANMSAPVIIDGQPDDVPSEPMPAWRQISHTTGTIINTLVVSSSGTLRNYYEDNDTPDEEDTGDKVSYGDAGFVLSQPGKTLSLQTTLLILPPTGEIVGAEYVEQLENPPAVNVIIETPAGPLSRKLYLPLIRR